MLSLFYAKTKQKKPNPPWYLAALSVGCQMRRFGFTDCIDIFHPAPQLCMLKISLEIIQLGKTINYIKGCYLFLGSELLLNFTPFCFSFKYALSTLYNVDKHLDAVS